MPARAVVLAVSAAIAAGIVVYHEREKLLELLERTGRKVALSFSQIADEFNPRQRQAGLPMSGRAPPRPRTPAGEQWMEEEKAFIFDEKSADTEARKRDEDTFGAASGWGGLDGVAGDVRHRGSPLVAPANDSVHFDTAPASPARSSTPTGIAVSDHEERQAENPFGNSQPYWSIHEWAENTTLGSGSRSPSVASSAAEEIPQPADEIMSEFGSEDESVGSWTEVGSSIHSDDEN
ncbi:hypothetical protein C7212DRAFT_364815 [Tuber magnatum]|uniref:Uncharacterized protein n=1 Tax=Tuber magnatum TaxID=42249 RepID=A0A317SKX9_9PEZI|nr:hypothetical protein C7212DRAFT_364815 [Tuber magnatum]